MRRVLVSFAIAGTIVVSSACQQQGEVASSPTENTATENSSSDSSADASTASTNSGVSSPGDGSDPADTAPATTQPPAATPPPPTTTTPATTQPRPAIPPDELAAEGDLGLTELRTVDAQAMKAAPAAELTAAQCQPSWTPAPVPGVAEITFTIDNTLWSINPDGGAPHCLARPGQEVAEAIWKPTGDQLLVNGTTIIDERGERLNGLTATTGVEWSRPTGKALIVPSPDAKQLIHVETDDPSDIKNIAALTDTWQAIYYPSGLSVIASGVDRRGVAGLFLATNLGEIRRPIATLNDPDSRITDMSMLSDGSGVMFIHDHRHLGAAESTGDEDGVLSHVHLLTLPDLKFQDLAALHHSVASDIVTAMDGSRDASFAADVSTIGSTTGIWYRFTDHFATPVGIDAQGNTYAIVRPAPDAPGQLWKLPTTGADVPASAKPVLLAEGVSRAMVRLQQGDYKQLPDEIEAQAPG